MASFFLLHILIIIVVSLAIRRSYHCLVGGDGDWRQGIRSGLAKTMLK
jgi:hypothetical protein